MVSDDRLQCQDLCIGGGAQKGEDIGGKLRGGGRKFDISRTSYGMIKWGGGFNIIQGSMIYDMASKMSHSGVWRVILVVGKVLFAYIGSGVARRGEQGDTAPPLYGFLCHPPNLASS